LEKDKDALPEPLITMMPEALDGLASEERERIYRMMKPRATTLSDVGMELNGNIASGYELGTSGIAS
jgi:hypothetical protein